MKNKKRVMETQKKTREHSLHHIVDDIGAAFGMGAIGGSVVHFIKGTQNSPKGRRFVGGAQAVSMNAPRLFSAFDYTMVYIRKKEDPWNSIVAGAATGGFLSMRQGLAAASRSALMGGLLLALIKGVH
ncbi:hypothetical protein HID58_008497 [Brassica napus]|uniref:Uncharacterized protein n=1 Tax=Brassica napus TaxID=3708 RepID=A0ABQ8DPS2_BRANA|nr:hypothetical protein HID58_008497 [Brassica napus]